MNEKLKSIFREVFDDPELEVNENTTASDISGWDSFNHINLVMAIEDEFSISFSTSEIGKMAHVGDLEKLLRKKIT